MTRDDIIRMADEAEMVVDYESNSWGPVITATCADLERFAALVAAAEREACARVCDNLAIDRGTFHPDDQDIKTGLLAGAAMCAATIKARGQK